MSTAIGGFIEKLHPSFGFLRGDDGRQYFFIPSGLARLSSVTFTQLQLHQRVTFHPFEHPSKGMRARDIVVIVQRAEGNGTGHAG